MSQVSLAQRDNAQSTIERCLQSVYNQTLLPLEIIIVDDYSQDNSATVAESLACGNSKCPVRIFRSHRNLGPADSRNKGVNEARGSHLAFLDSDDFWLPHHLELAFKIYSKHHDEIVISSDPLVLGSTFPAYKPDEVELKFDSFLRFKSLTLLQMVLFQRGYCTPSLIVRRAVFQAAGGFPAGLRYAEDFQLAIKLRQGVKLWLSVEEPKSVVYGKPLWNSGSGLSSKHWQMFVGTLVAVRDGLGLKPYSFTFWLLILWYSAKYLRRLLLMFFYKFDLITKKR